MIIMGIDPGLSVTGYGVIEIQPRQINAIDFGGIYNRGKDLTLADKLGKIFNKLSEIVEKHKPDQYAIEDIFYHENVNTAIVMGHARGVSMLAAKLANVPVFEYSAREIKMSTVGNGAAAKQQVQAMVQKLLRLADPPKPQDAADALAVAICHYHRIKFQNIKRKINRR